MDRYETINKNAGFSLEITRESQAGFFLLRDSEDEDGSTRLTQPLGSFLLDNDSTGSWLRTFTVNPTSVTIYCYY